MLKALTVSQAKPRLGSLLDQATRGKTVYLRRKNRLFRIEPVTEVEPLPLRPTGYFEFAEDELTALANRAEPSFTPLDEN
jgi:hypothetical protein